MSNVCTVAPVIETARLRLRPHTAADLPVLTARWGDPDVVRHITGRPSSERETWERMLRFSGLWPLLGFGYWAVEERSSGACVGDVGLADFRREIEPSIAGLPEIGWVLDPAVQGRGYATEAAAAALTFRDTALSPGRTVCIIAPDNAASIRVAEKLGFRLIARTTYLDGPTLLYGR